MARVYSKDMIKIWNMRPTKYLESKSLIFTDEFFHPVSLLSGIKIKDEVL